MYLDWCQQEIEVVPDSKPLARRGKSFFSHIFKDRNFSTHYYTPQRLAQLVNLVMFVLWSNFNGNLLQTIPWWPCYILAWFCSLSYTTNWALELHAIYSFFGWLLWKLGWWKSIMCVQAISQDLMVRKISWGQYNVKDNVYNGSPCKTLRLRWLGVALKWDCHFGKLHTHCHPATGHKGSTFAWGTIVYIILNIVLTSAYFSDH